MIIGKEILKPNSTEKQYSILIDNGDLELTDSLVSAYGFKDRDSLIKFSIATLLEGNNNEGIYTIKTGDDGKKLLSKITPPVDLLNIKN
jgi:hypothetical protein